MGHDPKHYREPVHDRPNLLPNPLAMFCIGCRYPLGGLTGGECPECGRGFDPKDATTYSPRAKRFVVPYDAVCAVVFALPFVWILLSSLEKTSSRYRWGNSPLMNCRGGVFFGFLFLGLAVLCICRVVTNQQRSRSDYAVALLLVLGAGGVWAIGSDAMLPLYALAASAGMTLGMSMRAYRDPSLPSLALSTLAGFVCVAAVQELFKLYYGGAMELSSVVQDYWTYWFWTSQR